MVKLKKNKRTYLLFGLVLLTGLLMLGNIAVIAQEAGYVDGKLEVRLREWSLGFDKTVVNRAELTGSTTIGKELPVHVVNNGSYEHNLTIKIETTSGEYFIRTSLLQPGEETSLVVSLPTGEYELYCSLEGHAEQGMEGTLVVQEGDETENMNEEEEGDGEGYGSY